jgi:5'-nucleotidase
MTIDRGFCCPTWIVDGSPGDCVNIALAHLVDAQPDAVVSGINVGVNASLPLILASGTVAGAWEGASHGLPAIAFSQMLPRDAFNKLKAAGGIPDAELAETCADSLYPRGQHAPWLGRCIHSAQFFRPYRQLPIPVPDRNPDVSHRAGSGDSSPTFQSGSR